MTRKIIATLLVDLETNALGLPSRLSQLLAQKSILRHTVERVLAVESLASIHVLCPVEQQEDVRALLHGLPIALETHRASPPPYCDLVRHSRAWGLDGWRGGIGSLCAFDEDCHLEMLAAVQEKTAADSLISIPAAAPLIDPMLLESMVAFHVEQCHASEMTIVQAPPGLGALVMSAKTIKQLRTIGMPPGALLVYQPDSPVADLTGREGCYRPATEVVHASGRLIADTRRSCERVERAVAAGGLNWDATELAQWLLADEIAHTDAAPNEIEVELTTECQFDTNDLAYPRGDHVPARGPMTMTVVRKLAALCEQYDDIRIMLGGFGEPTLHPQFAEICHAFRAAGAFALGVRSNGLAIPTAAEDTLFSVPIDTIEITLDAAHGDTYQRVHGCAGYDTVMATINRLMQQRRDQQSVRPLIVPSLVKCAETIDDLEPFVDQWQRAFGTYAVRGLSDYGGQWHAERAIRFATTPGARTGCARTRKRLMVLADGTVTSCDQDIAGMQALGNLSDDDTEAVWRSEKLDHARKGQLDHLPLCRACRQWHRP